MSEVSPKLFGRLFVILGLIFAVGSLFLYVPAQMGLFAGNGNADATQVGFLYLAEGIGFTVFGALILREKWASDGDATADAHA